MTAPLTAADIGVPLTPSKPATGGAIQTGSQRNRRRTDTFFDTYKHAGKFPNGRPFTGEREFKSGTEEMSESAGFITADLQCGEYFCDDPVMGQTPAERLRTLASAWECPWLPLAKYWRFNMRRKQITFALDKMIADEYEGLNRYWEAAMKLAGDAEIDAERNIVPSKVKVLLGLPSQYTDMIRLARAMQAGDPWLLGFVETPNEELAKIIPGRRRRINYIGGHAADSQYTVTPLPEPPAPKVTPEQVLAQPDPTALAAMIAQIVNQTMDAREQAKKAEQAAKMRDAKKAKKEAA